MKVSATELGRVRKAKGIWKNVGKGENISLLHFFAGIYSQVVRIGYSSCSCGLG